MKGPILLCSNCGAGFDVGASYTESLEQNLELLRSGNALLSADAVLFPEFIMRAEFDLFRYGLVVVALREPRKWVYYVILHTLAADLVFIPRRRHPFATSSCHLARPKFLMKLLCFI